MSFWRSMVMISPAKDSFAPTFAYKRPLEEGITRKKGERKKKGEAVSSSCKRALKVKIERKHSRERQEEEKKVKRKEERVLQKKEKRNGVKERRQ